MVTQQEILAKTVEEIKSEFSKAQIDIWIRAGFRAWAKRKYLRQPKKHEKLDSVLQSLSQEDLKTLIRKIR